MATDLTTPAKRRRLQPRKTIYASPLSKGIAVCLRRDERGAVWLSRTARGLKAIAPAAMGENDPPDAIGWAAALDATMERARVDASGESTQPKSPTVADILTEYARAAERSGKTVAAMATLRCSCRAIERELGDRRVSDLTLRDLNRWRDGLMTWVDTKGVARRRTPITANRIRSVLVAALNASGLEGPWRGRGFAKIKAKAPRREIVFTPAELETLVAAAIEVDRHFGEYVATLALLGCRPGEAAQLLVGDVRGDSLNVRVGKTGARVVFLGAGAARHLRSVAGDRDPREHLHRQRSGRPWATASHRLIWPKVLARSGLNPDADLYTVRHSFVSAAVLSRVPLLSLARMVGTSPAMISATYAHVIEEAERAALAPLDGLVKIGPALKAVSS